MAFASDNIAPIHPSIFAAIARANEGDAPSYGADASTKAVERRFSEIFERDVAVFFTPTGTAANALALAQFASPGSLILCHREAHSFIDECGAAEFFSGGAKMIALDGAGGRLSPSAVSAALAGFDARMPARALTLTQATECGTLYTADELRALANLAHARSMKVHMDGARFANAAAALGVSPADLTWRAGVDVISFGGTKNGCLGAEAVVFFNPADAAGFDERRRRAGALVSKTRFVAAQFEAYLADELWLRLAAQANARAQQLAEGIAGIAGATLWHPPQANEIFVSLPPAEESRLAAAGVGLHRWITPGDPANGRMLRFVCSWATTAEEVDRLLLFARRG